MLIVHLKHQSSLEDRQAHLQGHINWIRELLASGQLLMAGPVMDQAPGGVLILDVGTKEEGYAVMNNDPFVHHQLSTFDIIAFDPKYQ